MAFSILNGFGGELRTQDILDELDDDDEYDTHPSERSKKVEDSSKIELERIQQRNRELELQMQQSRETAARQLGELSAKVDYLSRAQQSGSELKDPKAADDFVQNFFGGSQPQQQTQKPAAEVPLQQTVRQELNSIAQETARQQAEEQQLANKFAKDYAHLLERGAGPEAHVEWEKLKALRGDLPQAQRYNLMVNEMQRRFGNAPKLSNTAMPSSQQENIHPEIQESINNNPRSEKQRVLNKAKETARRVKEFRKDQLIRTSLAN